MKTYKVTDLNSNNTIRIVANCEKELQHKVHQLGINYFEFAEIVIGDSRYNKARYN